MPPEGGGGMTCRERNGPLLLRREAVSIPAFRWSFRSRQPWVAEAVRLLRIGATYSVGGGGHACEAFKLQRRADGLERSAFPGGDQSVGNALGDVGVDAGRRDQRRYRCGRRRGDDTQAARERGFVQAQQIVHITVE